MCFGGALSECPLLWLVVDGAAVDEQADHAAVFAVGLGRPAPDSLPALDTLEAAVAALAAAAPVFTTTVVCIRFPTGAHERHRAARVAVALKVPLGLVSGGLTQNPQRDLQGRFFQVH